MQYEEFRDRLQDALQEAGLLDVQLARADESIDLSSTGRRWRVFVGPSFQKQAEPFSLSGKVSFHWSPFDAARSYTCEEDLLTELYDRDEHSTDTAPRLVRVDIALRAKLPYGSNTPMPAPEIWRSWSDSVEAGLDEALPRGDTEEERRLLPAFIGWRSDIQVEARCTDEGLLSLDGVSVLGYRMVRVPRIWDDPAKRDKEEDGGEHLDELAKRIKATMDEWKAAVTELGRWIKYGPPSPDMTEDPFADVEDDEPETMH